MNYIFPISFMANTYSITLLIILLGLVGKTEISSEIAIAQSATIALFYLFSANARSLVLNDSAKITVDSILSLRIFLVVPVALMSYFLTISIDNFDKFLIFSIVLRRSCEWLNEVHLSHMELAQNKIFAEKYTALQTTSLLLIFYCIYTDSSYKSVGLLIWAMIPLLLNANYYYDALLKNTKLAFKTSVSLLPHFGSSAIIGLSVYVFRVLIVSEVGKSLAGDLFTAFAIGGLTGGVFSSILGPSLAFHQKKTGKNFFPLSLQIILTFTFFMGLLIVVDSYLSLPFLDWTKKSHFFWMATGLSLIGGVIMVYAQSRRLRLLQNDEDHDVFGPDVMMNVLIVAAVPLFCSLGGASYLVGLYLFSSLLAYFFYDSAKKEVQFNSWSQINSNKFSLLIATFLLLPIFTQIGVGIFKDSNIYFDSGGSLLFLPLPLSIPSCFIGIAILGRYKRCSVSFSIIFITFVLMMITAIFTTSDNQLHQQSKLILLLQFILPMFGLVLGNMFSAISPDSNLLEKPFLYVLFLIVPLQLLISWAQGSLLLLPSLGIFSIYQSRNFVPTVFVAAYLIVLFGLHDRGRYRAILFTLSSLLVVYLIASTCLIAMLIFLFGVSFFAVTQKVFGFKKIATAIILLFFISFSYVAIFVSVAKPEIFKSDVGELIQFAPISSDYQMYKKAVLEQSKIVDGWSYYYNRIFSDPKKFFVGNELVLDRLAHPSAHNYYLDFIFNFGVISLVPLLSLIFYTINLGFKNRVKLLSNANLLCLFIVVLSFIGESFFSVSMRQPYPGIFLFFIWGLFLDKMKYFNFMGQEKNVA